MVRDSLFVVEKRLKIYGKLKKKLLMKEHQSAQISPRFFDLAKLALNLSRKFYLRIFDDLAARLSSARVATRIIFPRKGATLSNLSGVKPFEADVGASNRICKWSWRLWPKRVESLRSTTIHNTVNSLNRSINNFALKFFAWKHSRAFYGREKLIWLFPKLVRFPYFLRRSAEIAFTPFSIMQ